jgi:hypothetical protein
LPGSPRPSFLPLGATRETLPGFADLDLGTSSGYGEISSIDRNPQGHSTRVTATNGSARRYPWGEKRKTETITHEADDLHPEAASVRGEYSTTVTLKDRTLRWENKVEIRSDRSNFYYASTKRLLKDDVLLREKSWQETILRDFQ